MVYVRSRKFCCCLPVRFGVFCMALLGLAGGLLFSVCGWIEVHRYFTGALDLNSHEKLSLWFISIAYTWFALISLIGLWGSLSKGYSSVQFYAYTVTVNTLLIIGVGIYFVWTLFRSRGDNDVDKCVNGTSGDVGDVKHWFCQKGFDVIRILIVVAFCIIWLFQIAGIFIVFDYVGQLREEREAEFTNSRDTLVSEAQKAGSMRTTYDSAPYDPYSGDYNKNNAA